MAYTTSGLVETVLNNDSANSNPLVSDDSTQGYSVQSRWTNVSTDTEFVCLDASAGAAVWKTTTEAGVTTDGTTAQDAALFTERADHVNTPTAGLGEVWVKDNTDPSAVANTLWFTDDAGNDIRLGADSYISSNALTATTATDPGSGNFKFNNAVAGSASAIYISTADVHGLGYGNIWFKSLNPGSQLIFIREDYPNDRFRFWVNSVTDNTGWATISVDNSQDAQSPVWSELQNGERYIISAHSNVADIEGGINPMDATFFTERADHVNTFPNPGFGELWLNNAAEQSLEFTDDQGDDYKLATFEGVSPTNGYVALGADNFGVGRLKTSTLKFNAGELFLNEANSNIRFKEWAGSPTATAGEAVIWVRDDGPNTLIFTDDAGTDHLINKVSKTTIALNETISTDATEIVVGGFYLDTPLGTYSWEALAKYTQVTGGTGNRDIELRLYDMGADGSPTAGTLRSVISITSTSIDRVTQALTVAASPGTDTDEIQDAARMYEVRAYLDAGGAVDSAIIYSAHIIEV